MSQNSPTLLPSRETGASPSCLLAVNATNRSKSPSMLLSKYLEVIYYKLTL